MQKQRMCQNFGKTLLRFLPYGFIAAGFLVIAYVLSAKWEVEKQQQLLMEAYKNAFEDGANDSSNLTQDDTFAEDTVHETGEAAEVICLLQIPKIEVNVAVSEGIDKETLQYAVGHFPETALPGEKGNFCVVGHRSYAYGEFFNRLDEIEAGDSIYVERGTEQYTYTVTDVFVVEPSDTWVLDDAKESTMTLVTCTPIRVATHRLIVKAKLEE